MGNTLLLASRNHAKVNELKEYLGTIPSHIESLESLQLTGDVEEAGTTFEENSLLKARYWGTLTNLLTLADDGGLEIDALGGAPGVLSRRWPGYEATDEELITAVLKKLEGVPERKRTARLTLVLTLYNPRTGKNHHVRESIEGRISEKPGAYEPGFPYRALLYISRFKKLYGELTYEEHEQVNHRKKAVERIKQLLS